MAGTPGYSAVLKLGGEPVEMVDEPTTVDTGTDEPHSLFRITDASRRILDPDTELLVEIALDGDTFTEADPAGFVVDALAGTFTFPVDLGADTVVRVTGAYLPTASVVGVSECSVNVAANLLDDTAYEGDGARSNVYGLVEFSGSASLFATLLERRDVGDASSALAAFLLGREHKLLEFTPVPGGRIYRAWIAFESEDASAPVDDLVSGSLSFTMAPRRLVGRSERASFTITT